MSLEQVRAFTYGRQRLGRAAPDAPAALREIVGVYSSHPSAPLSLRARARDFDFAAVDGLRLPAMRGSIHLLPRATAHLPFRALQAARSVENGRMKYFGLTPPEYERLRDRALPHLDEPRTSAQLKKLVGGGDELRYVLGRMARDGLIVRVGADGLRSNALRYVRPDPPIPGADRDEARAWLAAEYLRAYGPVRREDFAWWSGIPPKEAGAAVAAVDTVEVETEAGPLLLRREDRKAFDAASPPSGIDVLPKWDMLTMGYPRDGRARFADEDVAERCYDFRGDGRPLILRDGRAIAAWGSRFAGRRMEVELEWFEQPGKRVAKAVRDELEAIAELLGATSLG